MFVERMTKEEIADFFEREYASLVPTNSILVSEMKTGWFVEHHFMDKGGDNRQGFLFSDFAVFYIYGGAAECLTQDQKDTASEKFKAVLHEKFGEEFTSALEAYNQERQEAEEEKRSKATRSALARQKVFEFLESKNAGNTEQDSCSSLDISDQNQEITQEKE